MCRWFLCYIAKTLVTQRCKVHKFLGKSQEFTQESDKKMDFKTKIDKVLEAKKLALWRLAEEADLDSTLRKAYKQNREMRDSTTAKFLEALGISEIWWEKGEGEIFKVRMDGSYTLQQAPDQWVHREAYNALESNLADMKARLEEATAKINELNRLHAQHNEQMKAMVELAQTLAQKGAQGKK